MKRRDFLKLGISGSILLASYPTFIERYSFQVNHYRAAFPNLPAAFAGKRILQLTDLHYGKLMPLWLIEYIVALANHQQADIIVCTGDYVHHNQTREQLDQVWPVLSRLSAPLGVYSVLGNHDHWADTEVALEWLERSGQNIRHRSQRIEVAGEAIWLGGAGDLWEDVLGVDDAFAANQPEDFKILLAHNPDTADRTFSTRLDLILSGHTHGGQVRLPLLGTPVLPVENKHYNNGFFETKNGRLFISKGLGWTNYPVRFNCPPEIAVIELSRT